MQWLGRRAVVTLPGHIDVSNAGQIRDELLSVISRGADALIADLAATASCDHAGAEALLRAHRRAVVSGTRLRLVVTARIVRRVLRLSGLDRLVSIYPSLEAAVAAGTPPAVAGLAPGPGTTGTDAQQTAGDARARRRQDAPEGATFSPAVLWKLAGALADAVAVAEAVAVADDDGVLALVNRRLEEMFGYQHAELAGRPVEFLIPADLRAAHRSHRAAYAQAPNARPMGAGARLVGLRKDGATFPVEISLSPVPTATGHLTLAVIRDVTENRRQEDFAGAAAAEQAHRGQELLDRIVNSLFNVGLSLQAAIDLASDVPNQRIAEALRRLDDTICEIRDHVFTTRGQRAQPRPGSPNGAQ